MWFMSKIMQFKASREENKVSYKINRVIYPCKYFLIDVFFLSCRLCMNPCNAADLWANCRDLNKTWPEWLCNTNTPTGQERKKNCLATCTCHGKIHD